MTIQWGVVLGAAALAVLGLGLYLNLQGLRRLGEAERLARETRRAVEAVRRETAQLTPYSLKLGERLTAVEKRLQSLSDRHTRLESRAQPGPDYEQAIRMAQQGASEDEICRTGGLGRSEARLIVAMHGTPSDPDASR